MRAVYAVILAVVCLQAALSAETGSELNQRGVALFRSGQYSQAAAVFREAIAQYKSSSLKDVNAYAATLNNLAGCLQIQGQLPQARALLEQVVSLDPQIKDEPEIGTSALNNLALMYQAEAQFPRAISLLNRVLDRPGMTPGSRAGVLHNMAAIYYDMGQYKKARQFFEKSLELHNAAKEPRDMPATLAYLAKLGYLDGDHKRARDLLEQAYTLRQKLYGKDHPLVALSLSDMGEFYRDTAQYKDASAAFEEALRLSRATVGDTHPYTAIVLFHYAESMRLQDYNLEALRMYEEAMRILEVTDGTTQVKLAAVYKCAAMAASRLKHKDKAKEYELRARTLSQGHVAYKRHTVDVSAFTRPQ